MLSCLLCMRTLAVESSWCNFCFWRCIPNNHIRNFFSLDICIFLLFHSSGILKCSPRFIIKDIIKCIVLFCVCVEVKMKRWGRFLSFGCVCYRVLVKIYHLFRIFRIDFFSSVSCCNDLCGIFFLKRAFSLKSTMFSQIKMMKNTIN